MKKILLTTLLIIAMSATFAQVTRLPVVYQEPGMDKVVIKKGVVYKSVNDTTLKVDIYYPPTTEGKTLLPVVIFNNGVGSLDLLDWRVYQDWAKLVAVNGMIAVNYQGRPGKAMEDSRDLVAFLRKQGATLKIDNNRLAVWTCSANTQVGYALAMDPAATYIRALVVYYGVTQPQQRTITRDDLAVQLVRAGLDSDFINKGMEEVMMNAMKRDVSVEYVNYPEGQHAFDIFDDTPRSKEIVKQTLDFFKRKLLDNSPDAQSQLLTNRKFWYMVMDEKKTDEALIKFREAVTAYRKMPGQRPFYNQLLHENNMTQMGYQLMNNARVAEAIKIFQANVESFPDSPNVYDCLGDAYEKAGDKQKAVANAKLALEKLNTAKDVQPQMVRAIRESAEDKIKRLQ